jgi:hypothetical protein
VGGQLPVVMAGGAGANGMQHEPHCVQSPGRGGS